MTVASGQLAYFSPQTGFFKDGYVGFPKLGSVKLVLSLLDQRKCLGFDETVAPASLVLSRSDYAFSIQTDPS